MSIGLLLIHLQKSFRFIVFCKCHKISVVPRDYERFWVCLVLAVLSPLQVSIFCLFNGHKVLNIGILIYNFFQAVTISFAISVCVGPTAKLCRQSFTNKCILHLTSFVILLLAWGQKKMFHGAYALWVLCVTSLTVLETVQRKCFSCFCNYEHCSSLLPEALFVEHFYCMDPIPVFPILPRPCCVILLLFQDRLSSFVSSIARWLMGN